MTAMEATLESRLIAIEKRLENAGAEDTALKPVSLQAESGDR